MCRISKYLLLLQGLPGADLPFTGTFITRENKGTHLEIGLFQITPGPYETGKVTLLTV